METQLNQVIKFPQTQYFVSPRANKNKEKTRKRKGKELKMRMKIKRNARVKMLNGGQEVSSERLKMPKFQRNA